MPAKVYATAPRSRESLSARIRNLAPEHRTTKFRLRGTIGNIVIGQMLPSGAVKGGTAMALRHGQSRTRFSPDVDVTRAGEVGVDEYVAEFRTNLQQGWHGFAGVIVAREPATPAGVPSAYVMAPFNVKLSYQGKAWFTILFELGHEEINSLASAPRVLAPDIADLFHALGLPAPAPVAVLPVDHQIAQKLHACSTPGSDRAHDLVDLQLLAGDPALDLALTAATTRRLFAARKRHPWPPVLTVSRGWAPRYHEAADGIAVLPTVAEAVVWVNGFISSLDGR
jgi:Nucleotidyl transferase AbiEii toxin, Type IV TA system